MQKCREWTIPVESCSVGLDSGNKPNSVIQIGAHSAVDISWTINCEIFPPEIDSNDKTQKAVFFQTEKINPRAVHLRNYRIHLLMKIQFTQRRT